MTQRIRPMVRLPLVYGMIGGAFFFIMLLILHWMGKEPVDSIKLFHFVLIPLFVFFSVYAFKRYHNKGELRYWQGMTIGVICYSLIGILAALSLILFLKLVDPGHLSEYAADKVALITSNKQQLLDQFGEEEYHSMVEKSRTTSLMDVAIDAFLRIFGIGLFLTTVISIGLRK